MREFLNDANLYFLNVFEMLMKSMIGKTMWCTIIEFIRLSNDTLSISRMFFQRHRIKNKNSTNFCFPASFCTNKLNVSDLTGERTYRSEKHIFYNIFVTETRTDDQFWISNRRILSQNK